MSILLQEDQFTSINLLTENTSTKKKLYIEGPFLMADDVNRNGRVYPKNVLVPAFDRYTNDYLKECRAIGEFKHPDYPFPDPTKAAIMIHEMAWEGKNINGKAEVLTEMGPDSDAVKIAALLKAKYNLGVSSRGLGDVKPISESTVEVLPGFDFFAVDVVDKPSGQTCYINSLYESEMPVWIKEDGVWLQKQGVKKLQEKTRSQLVDEKQAIRMFESFLSELN